jgi:outer membrane lipoprotein-sorting protein
VAYKESTKTAYTGSSGDKTVNDKGGNVLRIFSMSKDEIKANYEVEYIGEENAGGALTWHLKLLPRAKVSYKFAELWVDGNGMPLMGKVTFSNDDTDSAFISGLEKNVKLKAAIFKIDLPKGTSIVAG